MIVVLADDFSGAAEIAGLGLRFGLKTEVITRPVFRHEAELLVISTDTRSMPEPDALEITKKFTLFAKQLNPDFIFKKVDSVLRGYIIPELKLHINLLGCQRALLVPSNPELSRVILGAQYYTDGQLIHLTSFAHDPEFAVKSSCIHEMLRVDEAEISVKRIDDILPANGIIIGEASTNSEMSIWAKYAGKDTLLAGSSALFSALLSSYNTVSKQSKISIVENPEPYLLICGSAYEKSQKKVREIKEQGGPVSYMPSCLFCKPSDAAIRQWVDEIVDLVKRDKKAIIAIDEDISKTNKTTALVLRTNKAIVVERVLKKTKIKELLIEGGSTAAAIINRLNFTTFFPKAELDTGVIKMRVDGNEDISITLKPGSYDWPAQFWSF